MAGIRASTRRTIAMLLAVGAASARSAAAQERSSTGTLRGHVLDAATGQPIGEAMVALGARDTTWLRTDENGTWRSAALPPGRYRVRVRALGYQPRTHDLLVGASPLTVVTRMEAAPFALDQIVVTAARREQRLADAVTTTELVTRLDIERSGAADLAAVLLEQAGIELQGGQPAGAGVMLQGLGSQRVLVLLDGQPIAGRIAGIFDASRIPAAMIERVEVVKGPQSTLYGTDAMGGVINVITRTPRMTTRGTLGATVTATAGSQVRRDGVARLTLARGAFVSSVDVSRRSTETTPGMAATRGALARRLDAGGKLRWAPDSTRSLEASVLALDERQRWRSGPFYNFGDNVQWSGRLGGAWQRAQHALSLTLSGSAFDHRFRVSTESKPIAGDTGQRQRQRLYQGEFLYNGRFGPAGAHAVDVGLLLRRDETESVRVPGGLRAITTIEPFAQVELATGATLSLSPGIRLSHSSQWGTHMTPRLAARYRAGQRLTFRASVGEGYRAPDFKELYMAFQNTSAGYAVYGNPDLRPETSRNATVGAAWAGDRTFVRAQVFWNDFRDFIETRPITPPGEPPVYQYGNVGDGSTQGVELEVRAALPGLRLEGSYSGLATRDDATGRPLLGRATHSARATLSATLPLALRTSWASIFTGRTPMQRDAMTGAVTSWRDAFLRTDVRVARSLPGALDGVELVAGADNLFDQQPAEWAGFTGRQVYVALSWTARTTISHNRKDAPMIRSSLLRSMRRAALATLVFAPASVTAQAIGATPTRAPAARQGALIGTVVVAHGGDSLWNARVRAVAQAANTGGPVEVSFLMGPGAATTRFQDAVARLEARGVTMIVVVPLLVSSHSGHYDQIRYLTGEPVGLDTLMRQHLQMAGIERPAARVPLRITKAMDASPELARVLADRALAVTKTPREQALLLVGHGPNSAEDYAAWMEDLRPVTDSVRAWTGFRDVRVELVRDDAPATVRAEAVRRVRDLIALQRMATGRDVVVIPVLVSEGSMNRDELPKDIKDTRSVYGGEPLLPHPAMARWIESRVREATRVATTP